MTAVMDDNFGDDAILIVDDLLFVDEDGEPMGEVIHEEVVSVDADGNEVVEYESIYVVEGDE